MSEPTQASFADGLGGVVVHKRPATFARRDATHDLVLIGPEQVSGGVVAIQHSEVNRLDLYGE